MSCEFALRDQVLLQAADVLDLALNSLQLRLLARVPDLPLQMHKLLLLRLELAKEKFRVDSAVVIHAGYLHFQLEFCDKASTYFL